MKKKTTDEFIFDARKIHGDKYDYSKVEYINGKKDVCIICPEHGEFWQKPNNHLMGNGCPKCAITNNSKNKSSNTEEFIKKAQEVHGGKYDYSKVVYVHGKKDVCIICPEHGEFWQKPNNHLSGHGCPKCAIKKNSLDKIKKSNDFIEEANKIHNGKYDYSKVVYERCNKNIIITCPVHGDFEQTPHNHLKGYKCPKCAGTFMDKDFFIEKAEKIHHKKYDYSKVVYKHSEKPVCIICLEHGEFWQRTSDHLRGCGCPKCGHLQSKAELEIIEYLKQYVNPERVIERDREILEGKEIDILLPDFRIGIEFNGLRWHSFKMKPERSYHRDKMVVANSKGYRLIQIFEDEWIEHKEIVLNKLRHVVGGDVDNPSVGARKCAVGQINGQIANDFLSQYHIQGYVPSSVYIGAYYGKELVGVMTFTEEKSKMWNLTRFATKTDYRLPGLGNKMFKYFIKNYEFNEIKSFLDLRWNQSLNGNTVYDKLGFKLDSVLAPDYRYIVGHERKHKFGFRKSVLHKKYDLPLSMSEREMCNELGFYRIYDCGLAKYVYKNPHVL